MPNMIRGAPVHQTTSQNASQKELPKPKTGECILLSCVYCFLRSTKGDSRCSCGCTGIAECNFANETRNSIFLLYGKYKKCSSSVFNRDHKPIIPPVAPGKYSTISTSAPAPDGVENPSPVKLGYLIAGGVALLVVAVSGFVCYTKISRRRTSKNTRCTPNGTIQMKSYDNNALQNDA